MLKTEPLVVTTVDESGDHPVFRLKVNGVQFSAPAWDPTGPVPSYVRPSMPIYHYEFLKQVTPEEFRASVLYPNAPESPFGGVGIAIPVVPVIETIAGMVKDTIRSNRERRAREEVKEALRQLEEQRQREQQKAAEKK